MIDTIMIAGILVTNLVLVIPVILSHRPARSMLRTVRLRFRRNR